MLQPSIENAFRKMENRKRLFCRQNIAFFHDCEMFFRKIVTMDSAA